MTMAWVEVCRLDDIPARGCRVVRTPRGEIAVFRTAEDEVFALDNRCPHKGGPLSEGIVAHDHVACPLHGRCIDLATGRMAAPDEGETRRFDRMKRGSDLSPR